VEGYIYFNQQGAFCLGKKQLLRSGRAERQSLKGRRKTLREFKPNAETDQADRFVFSLPTGIQFLPKN
jgi:hypothetical protein